MPFDGRTVLSVCVLANLSVFALASADPVVAGMGGVLLVTVGWLVRHAKGEQT